MNTFILEQKALELSPLSRIRLADLLYVSLEVESDQDWNRLAAKECHAVLKPTKVVKLRHLKYSQ